MKTPPPSLDQLNALSFSLIEQLPTAIAVFDPQLCCLVASHRWCEQYPLSQPSPNGQPLAQLLPQHPPHWETALTKTLQGHPQTCDGEWVTRADGQQDWIAWQMQPWQDETGDILGVFWSSEIRTAEKHQEQQQHQQIQQLRTFLDHTFEFTNLLDRHGMILDTNQTVLERSQLTREQIIGQPFWEVPWRGITPEVDQKVRQAIQQAAQGQFVREELILIPTDDEIRAIDFSVTPVPNDQGEVEYLVVEGRDISDRREIEANLRKSEARLTQAQKIAHLGSWEWDILNDSITWSEEIFQIHGLDPHQGTLTLEDYERLIHPDDLLKVQQAIKKARHTGQSYQTELRAIRPDGTIRYVLTRGQPIRSPQGRITHLFGTALDITDRKQVEMQLQAANQDLEQRIAERTRQLQESEAEYRAIFEHAGIGLDYLNSQGQLVRVNQRCCEIFGYTEAEMLQLSFQDLTHPDDLPQDLICQQKLVAGEIQNFNLEKRCFRKDGSIVWISLTKSIIRDPQGNPKYFVGALKDISDRKSLEAELSLRQAQFDAFFTHAPVGLAIVNPDKRFVQVNHSLAAMGNHTPEDHIGKTIADIEPHLANTLTPIYQQILDTGKPILNQEVTGRLVHDSEGEHAWLCSYFPLPDENGQTMGIGSMIVDITHRKRIEREQMRLLAILDATTDFVGTANSAGQMTYLNKAGRKMLGIPADEPIKNVEIFDLLTPEELDYIQKEGLPQLIREGILQKEGHFQHRDGTMIPVSVVAITHKSPTGEIEFFSYTARDITDLKQVESQLRQQAEDLETTIQELQQAQAQLVQTEKMSSLGQLVAGVAHEINNPVNFIYGNLNHAEDYISDLLGLIELYQDHYPEPAETIVQEIEDIDLEFLVEDLPKLLTSMQVGADRIKEIVASLRNFSRMDEAEKKPVSVHEGLDSTLMILQNRTKAKSTSPGIDIQTDYGDVPEIECYAGQLNQVFMNILSNAIDALEERDCDRTFAEIEAHPSQIRITTRVTDNEQVQINIADNGTGIPPEIQDRLFDPFFTTKPVGKGTGLGLSISYQIITEKHNGQITCSSSPEEGTTFVITLPIHPPTV
ncbi:PAS domain S-box protein [Spirulina sp. CS-785/01]|uniref:PAS domain-containing sensor histidine kinase n=1 Tax=Spirulina sp. CS-785/01 TaxID=3021716 RepID=UPI00232EE204|nr:PAS domain S-box protein [Spirulina sp. CS-785/01]MDB9312457.1 PAS domain S-box protein [Spirulina sp. CS-785/01]